MMTRLDEIGENFENFQAQVASYTTNKAEQTRGGWKELHFPMEVDHVSGSEPEEEGWDDVDEVRRGLICWGYQGRQESKVGDAKDSVGRAARSDASRQTVHGKVAHIDEDDADTPTSGG